MSDENEKKLYEIFTTKSRTFYVVAENAKDAEEMMKKWCSEHEWYDQDASIIKVVACTYQYGDIAKLVV